MRTAWHVYRNYRSDLARARTIPGTAEIANAGVGSAMNDTARQAGGTLGVAVLGSLLSTSFSSHMATIALALPELQASLVRNSAAPTDSF
jgi:hypothetical protein